MKPNDAVIFIDRKGRRYLKVLKPGQKLLIRGELMADTLVGIEEGSRIKFSSGETFLVLRPTYADLVPHLPRTAQVIYPKDTGPLIVWGDVFPGATVIEGGVGAGALTIALLRAIGPHGRLVSYEIRNDFADLAQRNVAAFFGAAPNWTLKRRDLYEGFDETAADRMFLDLPEPGRALGRVAERDMDAGGPQLDVSRVVAQPAVLNAPGDCRLDFGSRTTHRLKKLVHRHGKLSEDPSVGEHRRAEVRSNRSEPRLLFL